jgi:DNA-binding response OmpR family regulator
MSIRHGAVRTMKILVVDDEHLFCSMMREFIVRKGFKVVVAFNGDEAMRSYEQVSPDMVILDYQTRPIMASADFARIVTTT